MTYGDPNALYINTSLKKRAVDSHTQLLIDGSASIMNKQGISVERVHFAAHEIPPGVYPDMTEHGWGADESPAIWKLVKATDILIVGTPLWLGEESLYAES